MSLVLQLNLNENSTFQNFQISIFFRIYIFTKFPKNSFTSCSILKQKSETISHTQLQYQFIFWFA